MINLASTSDLIQVVTSGTANIQVHASFVDLNTSTSIITPDRKNTSISSATTTTVVASPAASTIRNVKILSIRNTDASNANTVTVKHTDGSNAVQLISLSLQAGCTLTLTDETGWILSNTVGVSA